MCRSYSLEIWVVHWDVFYLNSTIFSDFSSNLIYLSLIWDFEMPEFGRVLKLKWKHLSQKHPHADLLILIIPLFNNWLCNSETLVGKTEPVEHLETSGTSRSTDSVASVLQQLNDSDWMSSSGDSGLNDRSVSNIRVNEEVVTMTWLVESFRRPHCWRLVRRWSGRGQIYTGLFSNTLFSSSINSKSAISIITTLPSLCFCFCHIPTMLCTCHMCCSGRLWNSGKWAKTSPNCYWNVFV